VFIVTSLVTKHFGFEKEWEEAQRLYGDWGEQKQGETRPLEGV
jgi:nitrate reductase beta subunit